MGAVSYRMLGPLQVLLGAEPIDIGPPKQRAVLAVLLLGQGRVVSTDRLIDAVWGDDVPGSATASLQAYISNLRKALRADGGAASPIVRQAPGYYLDTSAALVDLGEFTAGCAAVRAATEAGDWPAVLHAADAALALPRGPLLADLRDESWVQGDAAQFDEMRIDCLENRLTALLAVGRVQAALADASSLRAADPLRERGCWLQMLTLYRAGRGPDALEVFARHATLLDDELGLQPGPELRELHTAILRQAPELAAWPRSPGWTGADDVVTPSAQGAQAAPVSAPHATLVGRDRELATIASTLGTASAGATHWLVFTGPPGIGKTRLAEEAAAGAVAAGGQAVWVSCPEDRGAPPWWPVRQLVRALGADADEVLHVPPDADPDTARFRAYERIQTLLETTSQEPLCIVVDDVQWADSTSASCLAYLAGALRDARIAVVLTVRDGERGHEVSRLLSTVARGVGNRHVAVPALSSKDVAVLANQVADDEVTAAEAAVLAERTGGNPFFVSEYARLPREERSGSGMPLAVRSVLDRRLAGLDPAVLQVLRTAAVIGDVVDVPVLARTTRLDLDTLADYLDEAADQRIIVAAHTGVGYAFAHGLLREELLAGIPALRRQRLHARVADVLVDSAAEDAVTRRAQHLVAAQPLAEPHDVVAACRSAAEQATLRWSSDIAARWWQAALDAYDLLPAGERSEAERDALTVAMLAALSRAGRGRTVLDTVESHIADALRAGRAASAGRVASALLRASGGWPWLAPGQEAGQLLTLLERAASAAEGEPSAAARLWAALAVGHCYHPDAAIAADHLDRAAELAGEADDSDVAADVLMARLITYSGVATRSQETLVWMDQLIVLRHSRSSEDTVIAHSVATMAAMNLADIEGTRAHLRAGIAGSEELQLPVLRAQLRWMEAVLAVWDGDFAEARRHHEIAAHVHEQTELYEAGSGLVATASLRRETGEQLDLGWLGGLAEADAGGQTMISFVQAVSLTISIDPDGRDDAAAILAAWPTEPRAHAWTTLGHATLLAHLAADYDLPEFAPVLLRELTPFLDRIAVVGQVGVVGPVPLATARLHFLAGDLDRAREHLRLAQDMAAGAAPTLLRCAQLAAQLNGGV